MTARTIMALWILLAAAGAASAQDRVTPRPLAFTNRWVNAISYSGYRNGQSPEKGVRPSESEVREDLHILRKNWNLIRLYGSDPFSETVLRIIRQDKLPLKVFLGMWICQYDGVNEQQISNGVRLANAYRDIVSAVVVGNEALVKWSDHKISPEKMAEYLRRVRNAVRQPVSVADNYLFWLNPDSPAVTAEMDFILLHNYPLWDNKNIQSAMAYTKAYYNSVGNKHPDRLVVYGEAGWATESDNRHMLAGQANETNQAVYYAKLIDWASNNNVITFYFTSFDEAWKKSESGGPRDPEKHWGIFTTNRVIKPLMKAVIPVYAQ